MDELLENCVECYPLTCYSTQLYNTFDFEIEYYKQTKRITILVQYEVGSSFIRIMKMQHNIAISQPPFLFIASCVLFY